VREWHGKGEKFSLESAQGGRKFRRGGVVLGAKKRARKGGKGKSLIKRAGTWVIGGKGGEEEGQVKGLYFTKKEVKKRSREGDVMERLETREKGGLEKGKRSSTRGTRKDGKYGRGGVPMGGLIRK